MGEQTTVASKDMQYIASLTENNKMFSPCMVGTLESQFLKMQCQIKGAKACLDVGTFTGMSALAFAEGVPNDGKVVTLECYNDIAEIAKTAFDASPMGSKIDLRVGKAIESMKQLVTEGQKFDIIFLDADKENYQEYYDLALDEGLLAEDGIIMADNVYVPCSMTNQTLEAKNYMNLTNTSKMTQELSKFNLLLEKGSPSSDEFNM